MAARLMKDHYLTTDCQVDKEHHTELLPASLMKTVTYRWRWQHAL